MRSGNWGNVSPLWFQRLGINYNLISCRSTTEIMLKQHFPQNIPISKWWIQIFINSYIFLTSIPVIYFNFSKQYNVRFYSLNIHTCSVRNYVVCALFWQIIHLGNQLHRLIFWQVSVCPSASVFCLAVAYFSYQRWMCSVKILIFQTESLGMNMQ